MTLDNQFLSFSDNGITIEITYYQLCTEMVMFIGLLIFGVIPIERNMSVVRIFGIFVNTIFFVIQPIFYLNGDAIFRKRVLHQGLWRALKKELFQAN